MIESLSVDDFVLHEDDNVSITTFSIGSPAPREVAQMRPQDHGAIDDTRFYGPRGFEVTGEVWASDLATLWSVVDDLKGALALGSEHVLKFRRAGLSFDERAVVRVGSAVDMPVQGVTNLIRFGVSLFAPDPRIFTDTQNIASYDPTDTGEGGVTWAIDWPIVWGAGAGESFLAAQNDGTIDTPVLMVITGPATNPRVTNETTGETVTTTGLALGSGATVFIDIQERTLRLGAIDGTLRPDLIDAAATTWWELAPGSNQVRMFGTNFESGVTALELRWRSARI